MSKLIVICHGILSKAENMNALEHGLSGSGVQTYKHAYEWRRASVLVSGIKLAAKVVERVQNPGAGVEQIVLVGHSQGGLVCRVAAAALRDLEGLRTGIKELRFSGGPAYRDEALNACRELSPEPASSKLRGVATLATPNSGALTFGQLSILGRAVSGALGWVGYKTGQAKNIGDLTTDRLFRVLQYAHVSGVRYLSVSGSYVNRFSLASVTDAAELPVVGRLGVHLNLPNDGVVEDESVDLREAVLPTEIANLASDYKHVRLFQNCTDVGHSAIHQTREVLGVLRSWLDDIFGAPVTWN